MCTEVLLPPITVLGAGDREGSVGLKMAERLRDVKPAEGLLQLHQSAGHHNNPSLCCSWHSATLREQYGV